MSTTAPRSIHGATKNGSKRTMRRSIIAVPVHMDGHPGTRIAGVTVNLGRDTISLEFDTLSWQTAPTFVVGIMDPSGHFQYAGVQLENTDIPVTGKTQANCRFGGFGQELLRPENITPTMQCDTMMYTTRISDNILRTWAGIGVLQLLVRDHVQVCPMCYSLPTFRNGCANCGSIEYTNDRLLHHFVCAYVGHVHEFETEGGLTCPKCHTRSLAVGADYDHLTGPYRCQECHWSGHGLAQIAQCLRCAFRFPETQAITTEVRGYRANRLDPLALLQTS